MLRIRRDRTPSSSRSSRVHDERHVARHGRKPAGRRRPAVRHERDDRDGSEEGRAGTEGAENSQSLVPESQEQEQRERPLRHAEKPARAPDAEDGVHPRNQRAVADIGNQHLCLVLEPLLVPEEQEENDHRRANQVVIEVLFEQAELDERADEPVHGVGSPPLWPYDDSPRVPVPGTTTALGHALRGNTATTKSPVAAPISPSTSRLSPLVSPGRYRVAIRMAEMAD